MNDKTIPGQDSADQAEGKPSKKKAFEIIADDEEGMVDTTALNEGEELGLADVLTRLEEAEVAVRKHQDDVLRVQAEMQNLRRRTEQDVEKAHKFGQERFVTELLAVIDNLERALEAARSEDQSDNAGNSGIEKIKAIGDGVELTLKSFVACFKKFNIDEIDPLGEPFDPLHHQAISALENPDVEPNTVTAVMQKGYLLHGRVIRPAMVIVSK
jgi:molecular chaperone GrpE